MFRMKAVPYIGDLARKADNEVPVGSFGDITTTSKYKAAEKALTYNPNIEKVVGDSLSRNVAFGTPETPSRIMCKDRWSASS